MKKLLDRLVLLSTSLVIGLSLSIAIAQPTKNDLTGLGMAPGLADIMTFAGLGGTIPGMTGIGGVMGVQTADGADSRGVCITGGSACPGDGTRGGEVLIYGNESSSAGDINIFGGSVAGSNIRISPINASATISLESSGTPQLVISSSGVTSPLTSALGWTIVNSANQACNTTCTSACVFGFNTGALGNLLACTDATADSCLCAGAS